MMAPLVAIWRQPFLQMRGRSTRGISCALCVLFLLGLFSARIATRQPGLVFALCTAVPMGMLLLMWWMYLLGSAAAQCHAAALQLVPQLRRHVVRAVVLAWLAIVAIMTVLAGAPTGHAAQVALITGLALIEIGIMRSMSRAAAILFVSWLAGNASAEWAARLTAFGETPVALGVGAVVLVLDGAAALRRLGRLRTPVQRGLARLAASGGPATASAGRGADTQPLFLRPLGRSWFG